LEMECLSNYLLGLVSSLLQGFQAWVTGTWPCHSFLGTRFLIWDRTCNICHSEPWFISLKMMISSSIHFPANNIISFFLLLVLGF
jgi:hypothetical protein